MNLFQLNGTFLLRLSPYLAVGIVLLLAILVVFRQWIPGKRHARSRCCDTADDHDQTSLSLNKGNDHGAQVKVQLDLPLCGSCKGCRIMNCPGQAQPAVMSRQAGQAQPAGPSVQAGQAGYPTRPGNGHIQKGP